MLVAHCEFNVLSVTAGCTGCNYTHSKMPDKIVKHKK